MLLYLLTNIPDHIGDLSEISQTYQAPIFASEETLSVFQQNAKPIGPSEGDVIEIMMTLEQVIETHGHCPGHICLVGEAGTVSGDNAVLFGTILVPSLDGDMNEYLVGLERLRDFRSTSSIPRSWTYMVANPKRLLDTLFESSKNVI